MSPSLLIEWISNPKLLDRDSLVQLRSLIGNYPCFTPARVLYLKNLDQQNDLGFSSELNRTAISVPDRKRLYYFMEDKLSKNEGLNFKNGAVEATDFSIIDHFLHNSNETKEKLPQQSVKVVKVISNNTYPQVGDGFTLDYLSYLSIYPKTGISENTFVSSINDEVELKLQPMKGQNLIDAFLLNPTIENQIGTQKNNDMGNTLNDISSADSKSETEIENDVEDIPEAAFTETLAKIYLKQKRYDRALEIIKSLNLKYPEKNVYFADQIRFLEKLIVNTKKQ